MAFDIEKVNSFMVWENTFKVEGDKTPDFTGRANVDGEQKEVSIWINRDEEGEIKNLTGLLKEPYVAKASASANGGGNTKVKAKPRRL